MCKDWPFVNEEMKTDNVLDAVIQPEHSSASRLQCHMKTELSRRPEVGARQYLASDHGLNFARLFEQCVLSISVHVHILFSDLVVGSLHAVQQSKLRHLAESQSCARGSARRQPWLHREQGSGLL